MSDVHQWAVARLENDRNFFFFTNLQTIFQFQVDELENVQIFYFGHIVFTHLFCMFFPI